MIINIQIYVGNLASDVTTYDLQELFGAYNTEVRDVFFPTNRATGDREGYALVKLRTEEQEAYLAIEELNNAEFKGKSLDVKKYESPGQ